MKRKCVSVRRGVLSAQSGIDLSGAETDQRLPGLIFLGCWPWLSPAILDDPLFEQREDNRSVVLTEQPNDVSNSHLPVKEEMADREVFFSVRIEG